MANKRIKDLTLVTVPTAGDMIALDGASTRAIVYTNLIGALARERLTANRNYYVRTDGIDTNTGLINSNVGAFLTLQKAYDTVVKTLDLAGFFVTINVADGTYTAGVTCNIPPFGSDAATHAVRFVGNTTTPANCIVSATSNHCFSCGDDNGGGSWIYVSGFELRTTTSGSGLYCTNGGSSLVGDIIRSGAIADYVIEGHHNSYPKKIGAWTIAGNCKGIGGSFSGCELVVYDGGSNGITMSGTPAFSIGAFNASGGTIYAAATFSGACTGVRGRADGGGHIITGSSSPTFLPGNAECVVSTGGMIDGYGAAIQGTTLNNAATAGDVGEVLTANLASGSATSLTTATAKTVISVSLTAGDWDVFGTIHFAAAATTNFTYMVASISQTNNTRDGAVDKENYIPGGAGTVPGASVPSSLSIGPTRISLASTTTIYLVASTAFTVSTMTAYGIIRARRCR
jgi:hypothetical protein